MFREPEPWENDSEVSRSSGSSASGDNNHISGISRSNTEQNQHNSIHQRSFSDYNDYGGYIQSNGQNSSSNNSGIDNDNDNDSIDSFDNITGEQGGLLGKYTVDEAINHLGFGKFQYGIIIVASLVWVSASIGLMITSPLLLFIDDIWELSSLQETCLASVPFVGEMFGAYLISSLSDRHGRKKSVLFSVLLLAFFLTISALSTSFSMMVLCRLGAGFAVGGSLTALSLFTEFIPKQHRGEMTFIEVSLWTVGAIFAVALGWACWAAGINWRWFLVLTALPCWVAIVPTVLCPESPRFLVSNGDFDKLEKLLNQISFWNNKPLNSGALRGKQLAYDENHLSLPQERGQLKQLFYPKYRFTSFLVLSIAFPCVACYFGVALYQTSWLKTMSDSKNSIYWETLVCTCGEIPGVLIVSLIFDKVGRIPILVSAFFIATLAFGGLIFASLDIGLVLIFIARMCVCAAYNVLFVYILEYYPTAIRATALGFSITEARIAGVLASYIAEGTNDALASSVFCLCALVATICCSLLPTETLNKDLSDDIDLDESHMIDYGFGNEYDYETHEYLAQKIFEDLQMTQTKNKNNNNNNNNINNTDKGGVLVDEQDEDEDNQTPIQDAIHDSIYLPENNPLLA